MKTLAQSIIEILDVKANKGYMDGTRKWDLCENAEGYDIGKDIERLIKKAKREIKNGNV